VLLTLAVAFTFPERSLNFFRRVKGGIGRRIHRWRAA
jgi:hypothetical protein